MPAEDWLGKCLAKKTSVLVRNAGSELDLGSLGVTLRLTQKSQLFGNISSYLLCREYQTPSKMPLTPDEWLSCPLLRREIHPLKPRRPF